MPPLSEVLNRARRPLKVYGRRRGLPETREIHRQLFGTDENDENQIAKNIAQLSLSSKPISSSIDNKSPCKPPPKPLVSELSSERKTRLSPCKTPRQPPTPPTAQQTRCSTLKRHRSKHIPAFSSIPLTPSEQQQLQPLLSQPNVHPNVVSFPSFATRILSKFEVSKSGEGSFSECLLLKHKTNPSDVAILKIIPFHLSTPDTLSGPQTSKQQHQHTRRRLPHLQLHRLRRPPRSPNPLRPLLAPRLRPAALLPRRARKVA